MACKFCNSDSAIHDKGCPMRIRDAAKRKEAEMAFDTGFRYFKEGFGFLVGSGEHQQHLSATYKLGIRKGEETSSSRP